MSVSEAISEKVRDRSSTASYEDESRQRYTDAPSTVVDWRSIGPPVVLFSFSPLSIHMRGARNHGGGLARERVEVSTRQR